MTRCVVLEDAALAGGHRRQGSGDLGGVARHRRQGSGEFGSLRLSRAGINALGASSSPGVLGISKACASSRRPAPKLEYGCRLALSENQLPSEPGRAQHRRQNSLSQALEGLDLDEVFPSENIETPAEKASPEHPCDDDLSDMSFDLSMSMSSESKTARRRAEYNSKSKDVTFNQKKHMTPSYIRRLQRRKFKEESISTPRTGHSGRMLSAFEAAV